VGAPGRRGHPGFENHIGLMGAWLNQLKLRLSAMWRGNDLDRDLEDEMAFHLAMREQALRDDGRTPVAARDAARKQFGNTVRVKESMREL
jgi:hypothetical protein